ncbi:MAG: hypothetical protein UY23_C0004G0041 [Candidatus Jorgensenbacteria bacterium GW2011_GWA1_48_11]|uniref:Uncharacterized protein n=1 Tax=Candidatus Jorgensenbacteria bacterium GW2011_GWA1_48_11 TaxID=1618660 RepID=A0A0G1UAB3_9BACT|nr:MAG: hypothetical protein UY23_C0004G0041 [Candidatus Jorgensenbacteria bacterium GW2011_GWA1_48_11]KKW11778.1 MAG: hypothetical protein UY51_C0005G0019 [Candidatus Jorgensenbacteria bacterium GW2011_GWB1_49_9]
MGHAETHGSLRDRGSCDALHVVTAQYGGQPEEPRGGRFDGVSPDRDHVGQYPAERHDRGRRPDERLRRRRARGHQHHGGHAGHRQPRPKFALRQRINDELELLYKFADDRSRWCVQAGRHRSGRDDLPREAQLHRGQTRARAHGVLGSGRQPFRFHRDRYERPHGGQLLAAGRARLARAAENRQCFP